VNDGLLFPYRIVEELPTILKLKATSAFMGTFTALPAKAVLDD
jgi:hypothetical protein